MKLLLHPRRIDDREIDRGDHNDILLTHREEIRAAMIGEVPS